MARVRQPECRTRRQAHNKPFAPSCANSGHLNIRPIRRTLKKPVAHTTSTYTPPYPAFALLIPPHLLRPSSAGLMILQLCPCCFWQQRSSRTEPPCLIIKKSLAVLPCSDRHNRP